MVKATVGDVLNTIRQTKDKRQLRQVAEQKVLPHFDFTRMTQLAVGSAWRQANPTQQKALEDNFRTLLVAIYTNALITSASGTETVDVKPVSSAAGGSNEVTVNTTVKQANGQPVAIDYRLERASDGWKVYDVIVENLSLVTNYRGSFTSEIQRSGIDGLIKSLEDKNRTLASN
jgi:phospholipid transport system substrate-binding protein